MSFSELGLSDAVLKAIAEAGYTEPTPIQSQAIPVVLTGRDVLGCAQTGTGKTAGFTLPMIDILSSGRAKARMPRSLILAPTRELAAQVAENFDKYGKYSRLTHALLIGGSSFADQLKLLDRGVDVLIATPGRLLDLYERGKILLADVKVLVIDEADRMLDMGFIPDVERIAGLLPPLRQTLFFSATMPKEIRQLAERFLHNPKEVSVTPPASAAETVSQFLVRTEPTPKDKRAALRALIDRDDVKSALVFCNRKRDVGIVHRSLERHGYSAAALHGDLAQPVRNETLGRFKKGEVRIMVCSDVAARGLDIPAVSHVFNYDIPTTADDYIHRIGRTGRAGRSGESYTIISKLDAKALAGVRKLVGDGLKDFSLDGKVASETAAPVETAETGAEEKAEARPRRSRGGSRRSEAKEQQPRQGQQPKQEQQPRQDRQQASESRKAERGGSSRRGSSGREPAERRGGGRGAATVDGYGRPSVPSDSFGEHTPAFIMRAVEIKEMAA